MSTMKKPQESLRRRIVPSVLLALDLAEDDGSKMQRTFRLSFDYNAYALIQDRTGLDATGQEVWRDLNASTVSVMFWAAVLACQPEYEGEEGLGVIRSYMDRGNQDLIMEKLFEAHIAALPERVRSALMEAKQRLKDGLDPMKPPQPPETAEATKSL